MTARPLRLPALTSVLACGGCGTRWQSALDPGGAQAGGLLDLITIFTAVCGVVWLLVMVVTVLTLCRRPAAIEAPLPRDEVTERRSRRAVQAATAATVVMIVGLTLLSFFVTRGLTADDPPALVVRVRGYQWWWEFTYQDPRPDQAFTVANEIHVPVGRPVRFLLEAPDVIHSFWVPSLAGKQDLIPGRSNEITIVADQPGIYRGQCAQFCGLQHAHMAFLVIAEPPDRFADWQAAQRQPAPEPATDEASAGRRIFLARQCAACHTIQGTTASGTLGPDLTHVASRRYIAAGLLPTTRGSLAAWTADPQTLKPGNNMPMVPLGSDELSAVSAYLASLR
jgi:cytochrome c oxidase subunit 2